MEKAQTKYSALKKVVKANSECSYRWSCASSSNSSTSTTRSLSMESEFRVPRFEIDDGQLGSPKATTAKENKKPQEFKFHTGDRALKRAMFNYSVATKLYMIEQQKRQLEKLQKIMEEEEVRLLRKEMIPRAQLMPFFDRPFYPQRSNRALTVPREPSFQAPNNNCWSFSPHHQVRHFQNARA